MAEGGYPKVSGDILYPSEMNGAVGVFTATAGENLTANDAVYLKASDDRIYKSTRNQFDGFVLSTVTTGNTASVQCSGEVWGFVGLTANAVYYTSGTTGAISATASAYQVGIATATTKVMIIKRYSPNKDIFVIDGW